jgi:cytochrome c553
MSSLSQYVFELEQQIAELEAYLAKMRAANRERQRPDERYVHRPRDFNRDPTPG